MHKHYRTAVPTPAEAWQAAEDLAAERYGTLRAVDAGGVEDLDSYIDCPSPEHCNCNLANFAAALEGTDE